MGADGRDHELADERVESYTNLLYTLASAVPIAVLGHRWAYPSMAMLNGLAVVALVLLAADLARRNERSAAPAGFAALLCASVPSLWVSAASGLETVFVVFGQILLWRSIQGSDPDEGQPGTLAVSAPCALLILLRADGFVSAGIASAFLAARGQKWLAARVGVASAAVLGVSFLWRRAYYGDWLPNTYYAKVAGSPLARLERGLEQLTSELLLAHVLWLPLLVIAWQGIRWARSGLDFGQLPFPVFFTVGLLGYWLWVGGDHFGVRFLIVLYIFGAVLLAQTLSRLRGVPTYGLLTLLLAAQLLPLTWSLRRDYRFERYDGWITLGETLHQEFPGAVLALGAAGKVPYCSGLEVIDMQGPDGPPHRQGPCRGLHQPRPRQARPGIRLVEGARSDRCVGQAEALGDRLAILDGVSHFCDTRFGTGDG